MEAREGFKISTLWLSVTTGHKNKGSFLSKGFSTHAAERECVSPLILICAMLLVLVLVMVMTGSYYMHATSWVSNEFIAFIVEHMENSRRTLKVYLYWSLAIFVF